MREAIAVFCGSARGCAEKYVRAADMLGRAIARQGRGLVYGGGREGLMGAVALAALSEGGRVTAVHTRRFASYADDLTVTRSVMTETMSQRKAEMAHLSDAFVALPGGMGTLDEMSEMFVLTQIGLQDKPVGLLNVDGYFDGLLAFLRRAVEDGFMRASDLARLQVAEDAETLLAMLDAEGSRHSSFGMRHAEWSE